MGCFKRSKEDEDEKVRKEANKKIEKQLQRDKQLYRATHRLLLLGQLRSPACICISKADFFPFPRRPLVALSPARSHNELF